MESGGLKRKPSNRDKNPEGPRGFLRDRKRAAGTPKSNIVEISILISAPKWIPKWSLEGGG
jgi:hypothetical protein